MDSVAAGANFFTKPGLLSQVCVAAFVVPLSPRSSPVGRSGTSSSSILRRRMPQHAGRPPASLPSSILCASTRCRVFTSSRMALGSTSPTCSLPFCRPTSTRPSNSRWSALSFLNVRRRLNQFDRTEWTRRLPSRRARVTNFGRSSGDCPSSNFGSFSDEYLLSR